MIKIGIKPIIINPFVEETWKDIDNFEDYYSISDAGRVKSKERTIVTKNGNKVHYKEKILSSETTRDHHKRVVLSKDGETVKVFVHRLQAFAFVTNNDPKVNNIVNHLDGNGEHNEPENLEWTTVAGNNKHAFDMGLNNLKNAQKANKKPISVYNNDNELLFEFDSMTEASKNLNIPVNTISFHCSNLSKSRNRDYYFRYKENI